ncbi:hypothetical protein BKA60DRAFT_668926 [Fusarium oxysporum]|nr:hypothetical protein BKA60DRAFT_668926 [Fusarium oxysporum]
MYQPNESGSIDEEMANLFFDFDEASSGTSWTPMAGLDSTADQGMGHRPNSTDPAISWPSSSTIFECRDTIIGSEGFAPADLTSSVPTLVPTPGNRHRQVVHGELGPAQLASQTESEVPASYEFVALRDIEPSGTDISPNRFGVFQESTSTDQTDVSLKQVHPLSFGSHIVDTRTPVAANPAVMHIATHMASHPLESESPKDVTLDQGKRKRTPPPGGFLIPDLFGCSPWPAKRRTEQEQKERAEVIKAGGSCLLYKVVARHEVNSYISHHQPILTKLFEFIKCRDPIRGIGYEIIRAYLPENLTTLFLACFLPLRASQWKDALAYFDPDLERLLTDVEQISKPLFREMFKQCDNLFAARYRDVAVGLLGALHHELDYINALQGVTSNGVKHMKDMVVSRLKILCPLLVDVRKRQSFGRSTMKVTSAAIVRLDDELAAFLSQADLMFVHQIVQLWHDWIVDSLHERLKSSIDDKTHPCLGIRASSASLNGGVKTPRQTACYCRYVWEAIKGDISTFFQITAESLSSLLHADIETVFPIIRKDDNEIKSEKLGGILGGVFGQVKEANDRHYLPYKVTLFLRAMKFVPEFIFKFLPLLYDITKVSLDETQRGRQASTYRHLVLLSLLVQSCTLVDDFLREEAVNPSHSAIRPFESWMMKRREVDVFGTFNEAMVILQSIHRTVLERETGIALPELYIQ